MLSGIRQASRLLVANGARGSGSASSSGARTIATLAVAVVGAFGGLALPTSHDALTEPLSRPPYVSTQLGEPEMVAVDALGVRVHVSDDVPTEPEASSALAEEDAPERWDYVIVGFGVAGRAALTALRREAARAGMPAARVLVLEARAQQTDPNPPMADDGSNVSVTIRYAPSRIDVPWSVARSLSCVLLCRSLSVSNDSSAQFFVRANQQC